MRSPLIRHLMSFVSCVSDSSSFNKLFSMRCTIGKTTDTVTYDSPESISVRLARGERAWWMDWITSISCQVGIRWVVFLWYAYYTNSFLLFQYPADHLCHRPPSGWTILPHIKLTIFIIIHYLITHYLKCKLENILQIISYRH